jgi:site-specific DNA-methyltransferase (adenine-specific)
MDAEGGNRTMPIYNLFVDEAKRLHPRYITMIIPSRWMAGGLGLNDFRNEMLADKRLRKMSDFAKMETLFPLVDFEGGVCYFLWDRDNPGPCEVTFTQEAVTIGPLDRQLDQFDIFVRDPRALPILQKVLSSNSPSLAEIVSARTAFGVISNFSGYHQIKQKGDVRYIATSTRGRVRAWIPRKEASTNFGAIDQWKALVPKAYGERGAVPAQVLGPTEIVEPPSICTQSFLFVCLGDQGQAESVVSYYRTRFLRFLVSLRKITQDTTRDSYLWVPQQTWDRTWTDAQLYKQYGITADEQAYIEASIKEMPS